jgi:hypothetical protein
MGTKQIEEFGLLSGVARPRVDGSKVSRFYSFHLFSGA